MKITVHFLLFVTFLVGGSACTKNELPPAAPTPVTTGSLLGLWESKETRSRHYESTGTLLQDEILVTQPNYRVTILLDEHALRYRRYAGVSYYDTTFLYTRSGPLLLLEAQPVLEWKILELTDHRLTIERRQNNPSGFYYIMENRYIR